MIIYSESRFPRTAGEAFKDADYASPVTKFRRTVSVGRIVAWSIFGGTVLLALWGL